MAKSTAPEGYAAVVPYLCVRGADEALAFYKKAFGAKQKMRLQMGDRVGHAEVEIGGSVVMLSDEFPEMGAMSPKSLKGTPVTLCLNVASTDKAMAKAVAAGAKVKRPATDEFYGYRSGQLEDPFGHVWMVQQEIEKVTTREMQKRLDKMMAGMAAAAPAKKGKGK
jgi:PhnB protein